MILFLLMADGIFNVCPDYYRIYQQTTSFFINPRNEKLGGIKFATMSWQ